MGTPTNTSPRYVSGEGSIIAQAPQLYIPPPPPPPAPTWQGETTNYAPTLQYSTPSSPSPSYSSPPPPPPPPAPNYPRFEKMTQFSRNVLAAPIDTIQFDDSAISIAQMQDLLFEDIGAVELANISRSDLIDGQDVLYSPIKNLATIRREFNPNNIIFTSSNNDFFTRFGIDIFSKTIYEPYFDTDGNLVIEIDGLLEAEQIEVEILSSGTIDLVEEL